MAECSYSRCVQERRNIRRELQKWTKNMVYIVGLERIAEELMGRRKWKLYQESMSRNQVQQQLHIQQHAINNNVDKQAAAAAAAEAARAAAVAVKQEKLDDEEEQERLKDWSPQSKCYFCVDGKLDSDHTTHGPLSPRPSESDTSDSPSDSEAPPTLTPSPAAAIQLLQHNNNNSKHHTSNMTTIESVTSMASLAAVAALSVGGACPQGPQVPQVPFGYPPTFLSHNWHLGLLRNFPQIAQQQQERLVDPADKAASDQPLDLSSKAVTSNTTTSIENKMAANMRLPSALDTKHIFKAKPRMSAVAGRRTYTEEELQAALRDIQSGKLGTRRAAVIYGIPRSTLRNKVYKLAMERERESHLVTTGRPLEDEAMEDDKELSGAEEEKEVEKALQGPLLSMADILRFSSSDAPEALKALLLQKAGKEAQDLWPGLEHSAVGPYIQNLLLAGQSKPQESEYMPVLPELMRKIIAEEQHLNNGETDKPSPLQPSPSNSVKGVKVEPQEMDTEESSSNVILKIPSFKPTTSKNGGDSLFGSAVVSPPVTSESSGSPPIMAGNMASLREAIAKSISQKFQQSPEPHKMHPAAVEMDFKRAGFTPPLSAMPVIKNHQEPPQPPQPNRTFQPSINKPPQQPANNAATTGGKGTRPKRGKYRNYDRDSLVEAVRAVQRGEMSVHRAGSYYGVPHSTLEYKVKERHLMRPRKRDPKPNPVDEKIASMKSQEIRNNIPDKMKPTIKPPQKFPPTSPNGIKIPPMFDPAMAPLGYTPPPFPFWSHPPFPHLPLDYPRNPSTSQYSPNPEFYASQMMQRLQEDSSRSHPNAAAAAAAAAGPNPQTPLAKSAREMAESLYDGTGANGSFLDGIIRSSLESGVPGSGEKSSKEDKNVTPENMSNKALLDQLCRNSRITPLPKANATVEPNSSGDESYKKVTSPLDFATSKNPKDCDNPMALNLGKLDASPMRFKSESYDNPETIELSNDSSESQMTEGRAKEETEQVQQQQQQHQQQQQQSVSPPSRIYVKPQFQEITKPENLKPEMMVRFRDSLMGEEPQQQLAERNGIGSEPAVGSASEDMAQD